MTAGVGHSRMRGTSPYRVVSLPDHPLAFANGQVRVHRLTLYEAIGPDAAPCHWCGTPLAWKPSESIALCTADHLDGNTWNNDPANIVPSCTPCNTARRRRSQTHCGAGHEYTVENTYWRPSGGGRLCKQCGRDGRLAKRRLAYEQRGLPMPPPGQVRGVYDANAKLTAELVRYCREQYAAGRTQVSLAKELNISQSCVSTICLRKGWRHIA